MEPQGAVTAMRFTVRISGKLTDSRHSITKAALLAACAGLFVAPLLPVTGRRVRRGGRGGRPTRGRDGYAERGGVPEVGSVAVTRSSGCTGFSSQTTPPTSLRVWRRATGAIDTVPFQNYVKNVVPNESIPSWGGQSLRSGAMAAKTYAWWWANRSSGNRTSGSPLRRRRHDQLPGVPARHNYPSTDDAVASTWNVVAREGGEVFDPDTARISSPTTKRAVKERQRNPTG